MTVEALPGYLRVHWLRLREELRALEPQEREVLYMRFLDDEQTFNGVTINGVNFGNPGQAYRFEHQDSMWVTRLGINYRFGGGSLYARN